MTFDFEPWELPHMKNQPNDAAFGPACGGTIDFMVDELSKHARDLFVALNGHEPETPPIFDDVIAEAVFELRERRKAEPTGTEARICADIAARQALGRAKYGTTVEENPLPLAGWLRHAYEEALDLAIYLKRAGEDVAVDDAERFRWLTADHADPSTRHQCWDILDRMPTMSYAAACQAIDELRKGAA